MKVTLIGYGKMGRMIHSLADNAGVEVVSIIDPKNPDANYKEINVESVKDADVCIDFTHPDVIMDNIQKLAELKKNIVIGTTGWYDQKDEVRKIIETTGIGAIWSGNFSIGVNIFFEIVRNASKLMNRFSEYDPYVVEYHHNQKADSPSGTAEMIGRIMIDNIDRKEKIVKDAFSRKPKPNEMHVASVRAGTITGTHIVGFDSEADMVELKHLAKNRKGFAGGALHAARWIQNKKGFFNIKDMMKDIIMEVE